MASFLLLVVALVPWAGSLVTMHVDLSRIEGNLLGAPPVLWVIGGALVYVLVIPLYASTRRSLGDDDGPDRGGRDTAARSGRQ